MIRSFASALSLPEDGDGRTVIGRVLPFGDVQHIREMVNGELDEYDEEFLPGCTAAIRQTAQKRGGAPAWIRFTVDHEQDFGHRIGFCNSMVEDAQGVNASFRLYDDPGRLDKVRSMLHESHTGLSIEFDDRAAPLIDGTLRQRRMIEVFAVTATAVPIYPSARVLSMRGGNSPMADMSTPNLDQVRDILAAMGAGTTPEA